MDARIRQHIDTLHSKDAPLRYASFQFLIATTNQVVDWADEVWDELFALAKDGDNHQRAIAAQLLSNLAKSDDKQYLAGHLDQLLAVTHDERFVTARHALQSLWKVGIETPALRKRLLDRLEKRFISAAKEKNTTLIRYDIQEVFRKIFDHTKEQETKSLAAKLIASEPDEKYQKKYRTVWK